MNVDGITIGFLSLPCAGGNRIFKLSAMLSTPLYRTITSSAGNG